jgi:hypothetical protein
MQVTAVLSGLIVVRSLGVAEYAHYSLCVAAVGGIGVIADSGVTSAIFSLGGRHHSDRPRLAGVFQLALRQRRKLSAIVSTAVLPLLYLLLLRNDATVRDSLMLAALVALAVPAAGYVAPSQAILRLRDQFGSLNAAGLANSFVRTTLVSLLLWRPFGTAVAVGANSAAVLVESHLMRRKLKDEFRDLVPEIDPADTAVMKRSTVRLFPLSLFYVLQGQITLGLLGAIGATRQLASVSALQRFSVLFNALGNVWSTIAIPSFARHPGGRWSLLRRFSLIAGTYGASLAVTAGAVAAFPSQLLTLLGRDYNGLESPLVVVTIGMAVGALSGLVSHLNQARGWLEFSWLSIPATLLATAISATLLDLSTVMGAAIFMAAVSSASLIANLAATAQGLRRDAR